MARGLGGLGGFDLMGGALALNTCKSDDTSWYCELSRFFSSLIMVITIIAIVYFVYHLASIYLFNKKKK
jgi:hypothetical protein